MTSQADTSQTVPAVIEIPAPVAYGGREDDVLSHTHAAKILKLLAAEQPATFRRLLGKALLPGR